MSKTKKIKTTISKLSKIYHVSDVHIRNFKRHDEYSRVFDNLCNYIKSTVDSESLICLTGDIVHAKTDVTPELIQVTQKFFKQLADIAPLLIIPGNHDTNLNNSHRLDALTPIINAIDSDNIIYIKDTCNFSIANITFTHWSVFDKPADYIKADTVKADYKIGLFHGSVTGTQLDGSIKLMNQGIKVSDFDGFDLVLLGDIHKRQFLNAEKTIAFPGSLIQQNHAESIGHGILVWDLDKKESTYIEIENDTCFYTIDVENGLYTKLPSDLPKNVYLRLRYKNTTQSQIKSIIADIKQDYNIIETAIQKNKDYEVAIGESKRINSIDVRDIQYQNSILTQYLKDKESLDDESIIRICDINTKLNNNIQKQDIPRNSMWIPKKFKFDNMFSYGKGNVIDFSNMEGTYGIFAPNAHGKSTLLDSMTYCIFDKCSKTNKAIQVMNNQSKDFFCELSFELHNKIYTIQRKAVKQKLGNVKVNVDFYYKADGEKVSLNGKDRSDTNANIRKVLGTYEDFILTTLSTQNNNTGFIDMSQSDRKDLLAQFLDINIYEELYNIANNDSRDVSVLLKQHQKQDYYDSIKKINYRLDTLEIDLDDKVESQTDLSEKSKAANDSILKHMYLDLIKIDTVTENIEELEKQKAAILEANSQIKLAITDNDKYIIELDNKILEKSNQLAKIDIDEVEKEVKQYNEYRESLSKKNLEYTKAYTHLSNNIKKMENLNELKYDENCDFCMNNIFVKDAIETKKLIVNEEAVLDDLKNEIATLKNNVDNTDKANTIKNDYFTLNAEKQKLELERSKYDGLLHKLNRKLDASVNLLSEVDDKIKAYNRQQDSINKNIITNKLIKDLIAKKQLIDSDIEIVNKQITSITIDRKIAESNRETILKSIDQLKQLECHYKDYQSYLMAIHRDGIPHELIAGIIPQAEEEINSILSQLVDFSIVLSASDKAINAYIAYDEDNYWPLELTSGMEKFITSLAIRTSLINISSLPRPNFISIDEGFGVLDQNNLSSMAMLFEYLKTQFKFITIISHIDSMRDVVDSTIEIDKINGRSKIEKLL
jgi:DNA repair exonuclease SbcCD ATPase subunit